MKRRSYDQQLELRKEVKEKLELTDIEEDIAGYLRIYMERGGWTNRALATVSGFSEASIRKVLDQEQKITVNNLHKICLALGIHLTEFLSSTGWVPVEDE